MNSTTRNYSEKRNFLRMKVDPQATVSVELEGQTYKGTCHDLSGGGLLLSMDSELPLNAEPIVTLQSSHGHSPMLIARCTIARVEPAQDKKWLIGLEMLEVMNQPQDEDSQEA